MQEMQKKQLIDADGLDYSKIKDESTKLGCLANLAFGASDFMKNCARRLLFFCCDTKGNAERGDARAELIKTAEELCEWTIRDTQTLLAVLESMKEGSKEEPSVD